ncbi:sulfatase-like hydrolase/transferase, partial [bacterium]|nr:sulfatase-like hydrolase/transferase [bacterium]
MNRREFTRSILTGLAGWAIAPRLAHAAPSKLNVLLFTADDLGPDTVGLNCFGGRVPGLTPNLDTFAARGVRFANAHVTSAICVPSRGCLATGRFGFNSGVYGFMKTEKPVPTVIETLHDAGYATGILGKVSHSTPKASIAWDYAKDYGELGAGRSPTLYHAACTEFFAQCKTSG